MIRIQCNKNCENTVNIFEIRTQHVKHRRLNPDYKGSNSPPLMHDDQIPHPREGKGRKMPGLCPGGC